MKMNKVTKLLLVCLICFGLVSAIVLIVEYFNN